MRNIVTILFLCILCISLYKESVHTASAFSMTGQQYNLEFDTQNHPEVTPTQEPVLKEELPSLLIEKKGALFLNVSSPLIDFGILTPTNPIIRTNTIQIGGVDLYGYSLMVIEDAPLHTNDEAIPNTTCDDGTCTQTQASPWNSTLTYGFGYRCDSTEAFVCLSDFTQADTFKQFPDLTQRHTPQSMTEEISLDHTQITLTSKVNISGAQKNGAYQNTVTVIAVPSL